MKLNTLLIAWTAGLLGVGSSFSIMAADVLDANEVKQVQEVVHNYLVTNPGVLVEASRALQEQEMKKMTAQAKDAIQKNATHLFNYPNAPVGGNPNGAITLVEFFDYQCAHCKNARQTVHQLVAKNPNLRILYKELPIFGGSSQEAALAALASWKQGKYVPFHEALLSAEGPLTHDKIMQIAQKVGLDIPRLKQDMEDPAVQQQLKDNFELAERLNLLGTPTFIISRWKVGGVQNDVSRARLLPGVPTGAQLQAEIESIQK